MTQILHKDDKDTASLRAYAPLFLYCAVPDGSLPVPVADSRPYGHPERLAVHVAFRADWRSTWSSEETGRLPSLSWTSAPSLGRLRRSGVSACAPDADGAIRRPGTVWHVTCSYASSQPGTQPACAGILPVFQAAHKSVHSKHTCSVTTQIPGVEVVD